MGGEKEERSWTSRFRTLGAVLLSVAWITAALYFLWLNPDKFQELLQNPHDLAEFASGAVGPLALLWLIVGYFQQGEELESQWKQLKTQAAETKNLADAARGSELHARRDVFLRIHEIAHARMNVAASRLIKVIDPPNKTSALWEQYGQGDREIFFNRLTNMLVKNFEKYKIELPKWKAAHYEIGQFEYLYNYLIGEAKAADPDQHSVLTLLEHSGMANLMYVLNEVQGKDGSFLKRAKPENLGQLISPWGD